MAIIEMHASWLAVNSVIGCPNGCRYCLLQATDENICDPKEIVSAKKAIDELVMSKYYNENIPVCLLPNTDVFVNEKNIQYLLELLDEIENRKLSNDFVIITKCLIPDIVIDRIKELKEKGTNTIFYISYSGLSDEYEPNIKEIDLLKNFKKLKENNIDVIHYFRPLIPENSKKEQLDRVLDNVSEYTSVSVPTGLALIDTFVDRINFWDEIGKNREKALKSSSVWTEEAWEYFNNDYSHSQEIYQTNTCALNRVLNRPSLQYYNSFECENYNHCSPEQRELCKTANREINKEEIKEKCKTLLEQLEINTDNTEFEFDEYGSLEIKGSDITIGDLSYLSYLLGVKSYVSTNEIQDTYNSTLNGAKPLVLKKRGKNETNN